MKNSKPGPIKPGRRLLHLTLAMVATLPIAAGNAQASDGDPGQPFTSKDGAQVYASICGYCHESGVGPKIRGRSLPPEYIRSMVRHGVRAMPAFRPSEIDDESLAKLADFISGSKAKP